MGAKCALWAICYLCVRNERQKVMGQVLLFKRKVTVLCGILLLFCPLLGGQTLAELVRSIPKCDAPFLSNQSVQDSIFVSSEGSLVLLPESAGTVRIEKRTDAELLLRYSGGTSVQFVRLKRGGTPLLLVITSGAGSGNVALYGAKGRLDRERVGIPSSWNSLLALQNAVGSEDKDPYISLFWNGAKRQLEGRIEANDRFSVNTDRFNTNEPAVQNVVLLRWNGRKFKSMKRPNAIGSEKRTNELY